MLKKLFVGLVPAIIITVGVYGSSVSSVATTTVSTPRQFCEYFNQFNDEDHLEDCSSYSDRVGDPITVDGTYYIYEGENVTFKDLNFTYNMIRSPFVFWGGKLTIDGGTYRTTSACFFSLSYDPETGYNNYDGLTIISGDFIADDELGDEAQAPICLVRNEGAITDAEAEEWLTKALGENSYYTKYGTEDKIDLKSELVVTIRGYGKFRNNMAEIKEFNTNMISVRELASEYTKEPEITDGPDEEGPVAKDEEADDSEEEPTKNNPEENEEVSAEDNLSEEALVLPKAPNTGAAKM